MIILATPPSPTPGSPTKPPNTKDLSGGTDNILIIVIIIQVIILIGLSIRKKIIERKFSTKVSTKVSTKNPKIMHITWFIIGIGIILSILLYLYLKSEKLIYHTPSPPSRPPQTSNQLSIKINNLEKANGTYMQIGQQIYKGSSTGIMDKDMSFVYWEIRYKSPSIKPQSLTSSTTQWKDITGEPLYLSFYNQSSKPYFFIFTTDTLYITGAKNTSLTISGGLEYIIDITTISNKIYLLNKNGMTIIPIDISILQQPFNVPWNKLFPTALPTEYTPLNITNYNNVIYILCQSKTQTYTILFYSNDTRTFQTIPTKIKYSKSDYIGFVVLGNMLLIVVKKGIYYISISQPSKYIYQKHNVNLGLNRKIIAVNNYILLQTTYNLILYDPIYETQIDLENSNKALTNCIFINNAIHFYESDKLTTWSLKHITPYKPSGWILAPFTSDGTIWQSIFYPELKYVSTNKDGALCKKNTDTIWANNHGLPIIVNISGSACTHSFIPTSIPTLPPLPPSPPSKTPKIIFSVVFGVQLVILGIIASRNYLKLLPTQNFFNTKFVILLLLCAGITIAAYTQENKLTGEHLLRIVIGSQLCILCLLAIRHYK